MDLKIDIFTRNMDVNDRLQEYVEKKVSKLGRMITGVEDTRVDLAFIKSARNSSDRQVAQITLRGKGFILRTEERADDIFAAIDEAVEKMQRQISRYKGKRQRGRGDGTPASEVAPEPVTIDEVEEIPVIARRKSFTMTPMDELEAVEQMKLLGHENFFVFYNANTNAINVLYTRRDGSYGLIEPKVG
ncbi:MAG TPA: ribosome-associated translation inhibitor RaiA [Bellilinea sp.]|jgi:putative sigma-54 modulation protein|nr:ribosome-associated translation inhibitor RaiA [Bellilinea sp.]